LVLELIFGEFHLLRKRVRRRGWVQGFKTHFSQFSPIVNAASILYSFFLLALWLVHLSLVSELEGYLMRAHVEIQGSWSDSEDRNDFYELVDRIILHSQRLQACLAFYPFAIGCRFFSAFAGQPRLAVVTETLKSAFNDVLHFGVVLGAILLCYGSSAVILFGREVEEYETLGRCMVSVIRILLGDFDYHTLSQVGRSYATVWFTSFMVLLNLVMLNMLLAIIMDVYNTVKGSLDDDAETIVSQSYEIYRRWRQKRLGQRVSLDYILQCLERQGETLMHKGEPKLITVTVFLKLVQGLCKRQAQRVLTHAEEVLEHAHLAETLSVQALLRGVDLRVQHLQQSVSIVQEIDFKLSNGLNGILQDVMDRQSYDIVEKDARARMHKDIEGMRAKVDRLSQQLSDTCSRLEANAERVESRTSQRVESRTSQITPVNGELKAINASSASRGAAGRLPASPGFCSVSQGFARKETYNTGPGPAPSEGWH